MKTTYKYCIKNITAKPIYLLMIFTLSVFFNTATAQDINSFDSTSSDNSASANDSDSDSDSEQKRLWNLKDVDILALIGEMSRISGQNFIIDPRVTGKATLVSDKPMTNKEAYEAFLSILQVLGYATIDAGSVVKIVPSADAKQYDTKVNVKNLKELGDEMVVQVIPVKHVSAVALIPILRNLVNQQAHIAPYSPSNVIVIADRAPNVARIQEIIRRIDQEGSDEIEIITLKDANADEVVKVLSNLITKTQSFGESASSQIKLAADIRTNSVLLGGDKSKRLKMRALIAQMDTPTHRSGDTEVFWVQYQKAEDLVPVIASVIESFYKKQEISGSYNSNQRGAGRFSTGSGSSSSSFGSSSNSSSSGSKSGLDTSSNINLNEKRGEGVLSAPGVRAEPNTNSLVISAPQDLMRNIKNIIAKLDIRRAQILVEALIVEVNLNHTNDLGVEWRLPGGKNGGGGGTSFDGTSDSGGIINQTRSAAAGSVVTGSTAALSATTLMQSLPLPGLTLGFIKDSNIRALVYALSKDTNTNIVSTPTLVSMDNSPAQIVVARNIPFETAVQTSTENTSTRNSIEYRDVGLNLKITPMITKGETIKLTIEQQTGAVISGTSSSRPETTKRSIQTAVVVNNKDILVLGGLIEAQKDAAESKVPILGDIPFIGNLFSRERDITQKKNLMVFIRPVILRTKEDSNNVSYSKYDHIRDSQLLYKQDPYATKAPNIMPMLPDLNSNLSSEESKVNIPGPFDNTSVFSDILAKYNDG